MTSGEMMVVMMMMIHDGWWMMDDDDDDDVDDNDDDDGDDDGDGDGGDDGNDGNDNDLHHLFNCFFILITSPKFASMITCEGDHAPPPLPSLRGQHPTSQGCQGHGERAYWTAVLWFWWWLNWFF